MNRRPCQRTQNLRRLTPSAKPTFRLSSRDFRKSWNGDCRAVCGAYGDACESLAMELAASFEQVLSDAQSDTARRIGFQQRNSTKTGVSKDGGLEIRCGTARKSASEI
jgi:hypothetical protein